MISSRTRSSQFEVSFLKGEKWRRSTYEIGESSSSGSVRSSFLVEEVEEETLGSSKIVRLGLVLLRLSLSSGEELNDGRKPRVASA